jgi:hypothetical protein
MTMTPVLATPCATAALFHTATGTAFIDIEIDGHRETWPVRGKLLRSWLRRRHYEQMGEALSGESIRSMLELLEARAQFDAPERTIHVRSAEHDSRIYLDLADKEWRAVEITPDAWRVIGCPPVRFKRAAGMTPLPVPQRGGSIDVLARYLNLPAASDFVLAVAWLLAALRPSGPYPLMAISGEQGSAKTVLTKILRALVDPNAAPARSLPREERDLMIAANNGHVLAFDNLSGLPSWFSDALCRLACGGSFALRQLFTDENEILFHATRPVILNGIEDVVCRADLADRAVFLTLGSISDDRRRSERELWREFESARPRILGALLDGAVRGLQKLPQVHLEKPPRMADFSLWATACETAFWPQGTFMRAYDANRRAAIDGMIEADPVATLIREIMAERDTWAGQASDLLQAGLGRKNAPHRSMSWPKNPRAFAARLRRCQTFLRTAGIEISFGREGPAGSRIIRMASLTSARAGTS